MYELGGFVLIYYSILNVDLTIKKGELEKRV